MCFEWNKFFRRKSNLFIVGGLFFSMILYTVFLISGTASLNSDYIRAGMPNIDEDLAFYFLPADFGYRVPYPLFSLYSTVQLFLAIPILLTLCGPSSYYEDSRANLINQVAVKFGFLKYLFGKLSVSFVLGFVLVFLSIIFQELFATIAVMMLNGQLIHYKAPDLKDLADVLMATIRICLYYASLMTLSSALSFLVSKLKYLSLFIPLLLSIVFIFTFSRIPFGLAFVNTGYIDHSRMLYYEFVVLSILSACLLALAFGLKSRKVLL